MAAVLALLFAAGVAAGLLAVIADRWLRANIATKEF